LSENARLLPRLDSENRAFWTGGADGKLHLACCEDCGQFTHPPKPICRHCRSERVSPRAVEGNGAVETFTVNHQPWSPGMAVPFIIARVRLDEAPGIILTTNIVNCDPDEIQFGDRVRVLFEADRGIYLPMFEKMR